MSDEPEKKEEGGGVPAWVMTFADLMTLLMCFFVLLLAFSEMDVLKFKQLAGSMKNAFGVQAEIKAKAIPKGTSIIAREFSPGRPEPTALNIIRQMTLDSNKNSLEVGKEDSENTEEAEKRLRQALLDEIENGAVAVVSEGQKIIIRILEKASFNSGSARVRPEFAPVLQKIGGLIDNSVGKITVSGHTDDVPVARDNLRFRSNWDLSASRAVSVAHELMKTSTADSSRYTVIGHADTKPRAPNDTPENRATNRRVEISIVRGGDRKRDVSVRRYKAKNPPASEDAQRKEDADNG